MVVLIVNQSKYVCENKGSDYMTILSITKSLRSHIKTKIEKKKKRYLMFQICVFAFLNSVFINLMKTNFDFKVN